MELRFLRAEVIVAEFDEYFPSFHKLRTKTEFHRWCESVITNVRANPEFSKAYRVNSTQLIKKFREEVLPINMFLSADTIDVSSISLSDDTTNFDAIAVGTDGETRYLEVTCAKDGELERWENETLNERGGGSITHGMNAKGVRKTLRAGGDLPYVVIDSGSEKQQIVSRILLAINAKLQKKYPPSTSLIVSFSCFHDDEEDIESLARQVAVDSGINESRFSDIYLVNVFAKMVVGLGAFAAPRTS